MKFTIDKPLSDLADLALYQAPSSKHCDLGFEVFVVGDGVVVVVVVVDGAQNRDKKRQTDTVFFFWFVLEMQTDPEF